MKKALLILIVMMSLASMSNAANDFTFTAPTSSGQTLYYNIVNGNAQVTYPSRGVASSDNYYYPYTKPSGALVIPSTVTYNGITYNVTSIRDHTFYTCTGLTSITISNTVTSIGSYAFYGCSGMTSATIPNSVTVIDDYTFYGCGLTSVSIPNTVTSIGNYAFYGCSSFSSVSIPNPVTSIGSYAFYGCLGLTSATISNSVTSIAPYTFYGCSALSSVIMPDSIASIGAYAFNGCSNLTSIDLPNTLTTIGNFAFHSTGLHSVVIPNGMTQIAQSSFRECTSLINVTIPSSINYIDDYAFYGCTNLVSLAVPSSVSSIGTCAFYGVNNVAYFGSASGGPWCATNLNSNNEDSLLYSDSSKTILIGANPLITSVVIPPSVTTISTCAFINCTNLTTITIPNSVTTLGQSAFGGCSNLSSATIGNGITEIPESTFANTGLTSITIPNTVTTLGQAAFSGCYSLSSVTLGNGITVIPTNAFANTGLTTITIPNTVTSLGQAAFSGCSNLTSLNVSNNIQSIGNYAFENCTGLTTLSYNTAATATGIFFGCSALANVTLGNNVTSIPDGMFEGCTNLSTSPLTNNIQTIGEYAFYNTNISTITIPQCCTSIGSYAFNECPLNTVTALPDTPPTIGSNVFSSYPTIFVPCGQGSAYRSSWYQYSSLISEPEVEFALNVLASEGGQAYATSEISCVDSTATISAENDYGYHFDHWSDGNTDNPRTIHVTSDTTVTAIFARNSYTITLSSSNEAMGSTTGGGTYLYGDTVSLMAVPVDHYHFMRWRTTDYYGYEVILNENPLEMVVAEDRMLTADFAIDTYYVNVIPNEVTRGSVTGGGYFEYGSPVTVSASAYSGYQFVRWSNGAEYNPYTFAATNDMTLEAVFMEEGTVYHVEATSDNSVMGTVTGGGPYATGETAILTAVAYPGYHFVRWQDDVTDNPRTITVTQDATFVAYFEANVGIEKISDTGIIVYSKDFQIHIDEALGERITVYSIDGKIIASLPKTTDHVAIPVTNTGVYIVKIGNHPARKIVVVR